MDDFGTTDAEGMPMKSGGLSPKTEALPGSLAFELRRCAKPNSRWARGQPHGPSAYRYVYAAGRRRKRYVPRARVAEVAAGIARWQELHPPAWTMRQLLAELRRMEQEVLG